MLAVALWVAIWAQTNHIETGEEIVVEVEGKAARTLFS
jgi:hypothetical protein